VHEQVAAAPSRWRNVLFRCKSAQTVVVHKCHKVRRYLSNQNVDTEVELPIIDQIWLCLIVLDDVTLVSGNVLNLSRNENTLALALILWFDYQSDSSSTRSLLSQKVVKVEKLIGSDPGPREEGVVLWESLLHQLQVFRQVMF
jgi:hypothetical protein